MKIVDKIRLRVGVRNLEHLNKSLKIFVKNLYFSRIYGVKIKKISHLASFKGEGVIPPAPLQQATGQIFEYDVNVFSSTLDIFFMAILYLDLCLRGRGGICYRGHICNTRIFHSFRQAAVELEQPFFKIIPLKARNDGTDVYN
jgi:hypothetical protein